MDLNNISYSFDCTWGQEENLRSLLTFGNSDDPSEKSNYEGEIEHVISDDLFVHLQRSESDESCTIKVDLKDSGLKITKFSVVCESRLIEIYGKCGEYIGTEDCTFLASVSDRNMYNVQPDVFPTSQIGIKFLGVKDSTWIYGLKLLLKQEGPSPSYFDYKNIEEMLKYSKIPISEKADRAKKFLQNYANVFTSNPPKAEHQMLIKMLEEQYLSQFTPVGDVGKNMSKYLSNLIPTKSKTNENGSESTSMNELKQYVDNSVRQLEERVQNSIAQQFKEFEAKQNEKLDSIIKLLSKKVSS